jgi:hypothetical protein
MITMYEQVDAPVFTSDETAEFEADVAAAGGLWSVFEFDQPGVANDIEQAFWGELRDRHVGQDFASPEAKEAAWNAYMSEVDLYTAAVQTALIRLALAEAN